MSVKKRLFWSHILMFALPMLTYLLFSLLADRLSWLYLLQQRFSSMEDFQHHVRLTEQFSRWFTLGGLTLTLLIVNRFLSRGVLKKIEGSLRELSEGLRHLREGDLGCRLPLEEDDEFAAVRTDFNATASQLQRLVEEQQQNERNRQELLAGLEENCVKCILGEEALPEEDPPEVQAEKLENRLEKFLATPCPELLGREGTLPELRQKLRQCRREYLEARENLLLQQNIIKTYETSFFRHCGEKVQESEV